MFISFRACECKCECVCLRIDLAISPFRSVYSIFRSLFLFSIVFLIIIIIFHPYLLGCCWWPRAYTAISRPRQCLIAWAFLISFFSSSFHIKILFSHMYVINCCCYLLNIKIRTNENSRRLKRLNKLSAPLPCSLFSALQLIRLENALWKKKKKKKKFIIKSSNGYSTGSSSRKPTSTW